MNQQQSKKLKLGIFLNVEACCRRRGLIKKVNGIETYKEGTQSFIEKQIECVLKLYQDELDGKKKPFLIDKKDFFNMVRIFTYKRINNYYHKYYLQKINRSQSKEEFILSFNGQTDPYADDSDKYLDIARAENLTRFTEPMSGINRNPEELIAEAQTIETFNQCLENLSRSSKNGPIYNKIIQFYRDEYHEGLKKSEEISALASFIGKPSKRTSVLKCQAMKRLYRALSKLIPLEDVKSQMRHRKDLVKRFKKIPNRKLREIYKKKSQEPDTPFPVKSLKDFAEAELDEIKRNHCCPDSPYFQQIRPRKIKKSTLIDLGLPYPDFSPELFEEAA